MKIAILVVMILILTITWIFYMRLKNKQDSSNRIYAGSGGVPGENQTRNFSQGKQMRKSDPPRKIQIESRQNDNFDVTSPLNPANPLYWGAGFDDHHKHGNSSFSSEDRSHSSSKHFNDDSYSRSDYGGWSSSDSSSSSSGSWGGDSGGSGGGFD